MSWYSFIFSEKKAHRLQRHLLFWFLWWIYFTASYFHYEQSGLQKVEFEPWNVPFFIKSMLLLLIHAIACYYFIAYVMPRYLLKAKYAALVIQTLLLGFLVLMSSYFIHKTVVPFLNNLFNYEPVVGNQNIWWTSITSGLLSAPKVISAAAAILLIKRWWLKQKEKERLEKEKLETDLQLLKTQIHPEFLFSSLENIRLLSQKKDTEKASVLLLKLADILSYMLYDCNNNLVLLEKEIKAIKDYLVLEKIRMGDSLELDMATKGEIGNKKITPLLLFSFIENSFSYMGNKNFETNWLNLELQCETSELTMKLIHGKTIEASVLSLNGNVTDNAMKRLDFFYPDRYELKTTIEPEIMMTYLRINLEQSEKETKNPIRTPEQMTYATA